MILLHLQKVEIEQKATRLHVGHLTRNVTDGHLKEIFGNFGAVKAVELAIDKIVMLPRGFAYVEFETYEEASKAKSHMDGGQIDGNVLRCISEYGYQS